jgi:hypothetical protein
MQCAASPAAPTLHPRQVELHHFTVCYTPFLQEMTRLLAQLKDKPKRGVLDEIDVSRARPLPHDACERAVCTRA